jgi:hypothetical protein
MEVAVSVYRAIAFRSQFVLTTQGKLPGRLAEVSAVPVAELGTADDGSRTLSFTPPITRDGVYPVRVELRRAGGPVVDSFDTYLLSAPPATDVAPLDVAWMAPIHAPPAVQPDGHVAIDDQRAESLSGLAKTFDRHPEVAFTMVPTPETTEALSVSPRQADRETLATLVRSLRTRQLLGGPYVPTNITSMLSSGLEGEAAAELTRGTNTLDSLFSAPPTTATRLIDERVDDAALAFLAAQDVGQVVVPESLLEPIVRNTTLTETFEIDSRGKRIRAGMADAGFVPHFAVRNQVQAAVRLLADLAVLYFDDPTVAQRGVVVAPPRSWEPSGVFADTLLSGLGDSPILQPVTIDAYFAGVRPSVSKGTTLVRRIVGGPAPGATALPGASIRSARRQIDAFASAVDANNPVLDRMDRTLLAASSSDLRARDRSRYVSGVVDQLTTEMRGIDMPRSRSITLTAREGEIPVTVTNNLGYPIRARLRISSDTLEFPKGAERDVPLERRNTTVNFVVRAQSSGSFPLRVQLVSPQGDLVLDQSRFTVRSTALSGVGTALSIGAGLFLLIWWGNHLRLRRSRRLVPA